MTMSEGYLGEILSKFQRELYGKISEKIIWQISDSENYGNV